MSLWVSDCTLHCSAVHCDTMALWQCDTLHCDTVTQWNCDTMALLHSDTVTQWHCYTVAQWHFYTVTQWHCVIALGVITPSKTYRNAFLLLLLLLTEVWEYLCMMHWKPQFLKMKPDLPNRLQYSVKLWNLNRECSSILISERVRSFVSHVFTYSLVFFTAP